MQGLAYRMFGIDVPDMLADESVALRRLGEQDAFFYCLAFRDDVGLAAKLGMESGPSEDGFRRRLARAADHRAGGTEVGLAIVGSDSEQDEILGTLLLHSLQPHHRRAEITPGS